MEHSIGTIPQKIRDAVCEELERRIEEAESYLEITQEERDQQVAELAESIKESLKTQLEGIEVESVATEAASRAVDVIEKRLGNLRYRAVQKTIEQTVSSLMLSRLQKAERYLKLLVSVRASKEHQLPWLLSELFRERLDACEDWVTLSEVDWSRIRAIVLPERDESAWRRYSREALALWSKFCRTVLPESYGDPQQAQTGTTELPGTWEKVDVMATRRELGMDLFSSKDAREVRDNLGVIAPQASTEESGKYRGNGKKDARTINGERAQKVVVILQGINRQVIGEDQVVEDDLRLSIKNPGKKERKSKKVEQSSMLPFAVE